MLEIGVLLRQARLERGLSLEDAQRATKIRTRYLEAMENGDFEALPGEVYAKGFLRNYASFLGLPGDDLVARYKDEMARREREAERARMEALASRRAAGRRESRTRRRVALATCLASAVVLATVALAVLQARQARVAPASQQQPPAALSGHAAGEAPEVASSAPQDLWSRMAPPGAPAAEAQAGAAAREGHELSVVATERCWVKVTCDGDVVFERSMLKGESAAWRASTSIRIRVGNAGGIDATFDGVHLGALGRPGEVVERAFPVP